MWKTPLSDNTTFIHDLSKYEAAAQTDKAAIEAMDDALAGSNRPLIVTAGTAGLQSSHEGLVTEDNAAPSVPRTSEVAALSTISLGVKASIIRLLPSVHDKGDRYGFVPTLINIGVPAYVGEGSNRWPAIHRLDSAHLFRLALEKGRAGSRYNGVADEAIRVCEIAELIGKRLNLPVASDSPE